MSKELGPRLPAVVVERFSGTDLEQELGAGYVVVTVDEDGSPRTSMLSAGEILATDDWTLRFGLWPGTNTGANMDSGRSVVLCFVAPHTVVYVTGRGRRLFGDETIEGYEVAVESVKSDSHPGMPVTQGITFTCAGVDPDEVLDMWRRQLEKLREAA